MIRQYRAFEDFEEPCFLVPEPEWITVTYQMKSIICQWRWDEIKELVPKKLSPTKKKSTRDSESIKDLTHSQTQIKTHSNSVPGSPNHHTHHHPEKVLKKNLLKIEFLKSESKDKPSKPKWYRFDTRDILDEFLSDANRHGYIERLVASRWFSTKVKYVPKFLTEHQQVDNSNVKKDKKKINKKRNSLTSSSSSSSSDSINKITKKTKKTMVNTITNKNINSHDNHVLEGTRI